MLFLPAAPGTVGDGYATCTQCGRGVDPADMCDLDGNTDRCNNCAETTAVCAECGDEHPAHQLDLCGHCDPCAALLTNVPAPIPATRAA